MRWSWCQAMINCSAFVINCSSCCLSLSLSIVTIYASFPPLSRHSNSNQEANSPDPPHLLDKHRNRQKNERKTKQSTDRHDSLPFSPPSSALPSRKSSSEQCLGDVYPTGQLRMKQRSRPYCNRCFHKENRQFSMKQTTLNSFFLQHAHPRA